MPRILLVVAAALCAIVNVVATASAQGYPQRTVKFILPFGPPAAPTSPRAWLPTGFRRAGQAGGDREPAGWRRARFDQRVHQRQRRSPLLWVPVGTFAVHPYQHEKLPYDAERDLVPVANVSTLFLAMSAPATMNVGSFREFFELVRANPGKFNVAAANGTADFLITGFLKSNNLQMAKVPYRDIMQGPNDLAEGRIQLLSSSLAIVTPLMHAGKIKVLAVTGRQRAASAPNVPTVREAGYPALEMESIGGIFGPRGMPLPPASKSPPTCARPSPATPRSGKSLKPPVKSSTCAGRRSSPPASRS